LESRFFHHSRGGLACQDFAYRFAGAQILEDLTTPTPPELNAPYVALDDDLRVGRCWRVPQISGQLGIRLSHRIKITHLSVDHIPQELVLDRMHAPRDIILWGVIDSPSPPLPQHEADPIWDAMPRRGPLLNRGLMVVPLVAIQYNITTTEFVQTFNVSHSIFANHTFSTVIIEVLNNWGADWTCVYRIRIHGEAVF
ncbi:hypothetical protein BDN72DRAFT_765971, partial [Pluteus cervinus]